MADQVVITGLGIVSPIGTGLERFWESLCQGRSGASPVDGLDTTALPRRIACQVDDPVDVGRPMGRAARLAVSAAREAVRSAGLVAAAVESGRLAVTVGTTMGETEFIEEGLGCAEDDWLSTEHVRRIAAGR